MDKNRLYYGDNLEILKRLPAEIVDLCYADPPFGSNANYNVLFENREGDESHAQIEAFEDTWSWTHETEHLYSQLIDGAVPLRVADTIEAMRRILGPSDILAYLVMMTPRLVEMHRVMKQTASMYLHCDPTASHYLKLILDAVFGADRMGAEIIWQRTTAHSDSRQGRQLYGRIHDVILFYTKSDEWTWNTQFVPYDEEYVSSKYRHVEDGTGRRYRLDNLTGPGGAAKGNPSYEVMGVTRYWRYSKERMAELIEEGRIVQTAPGNVPQYKRYLDEMPGVPLQDMWTDIRPINSRAKERLGYPTQKPRALLDRIIKVSSNPGDVIMDPFAGCGTTVASAQAIGAEGDGEEKRRWIGIDVTYIAIDLITKRLRDTHGDEVMEEIEINGLPRDLPGATALFERNPFDFERWAVSLVNGQPNEKQVGDRGIDGVIRFPITTASSGKKTGKVLVSVKGGQNIGPAMVRDLGGTVDTENAQMGLLITLHEPTKGMKDAAAKGGVYTNPWNGVTYPKLQIITIKELIEEHKSPDLPGVYMPYVQAEKLIEPDAEQVSLLD